jgi:hypothetical protein
VDDDGTTVEVSVSDSGPALLEAVRRLDGARIEPRAITVREPSLDDVFLQLTGRHVDADENDTTEEQS